ncbi:ABCA2 isoform 4, partial [Pan troglodytes]
TGRKMSRVQQGPPRSPACSAHGERSWGLGFPPFRWLLGIAGRTHLAALPPFQWVLAFEIFIPLVLFFILLGLRQKKPTISVKEVSFYTAAPLTSAGILPVMQSLCPDGQRDEFGFLQYANST